jgi:hypothetical protein
VGDYVVIRRDDGATTKATGRTGGGRQSERPKERWSGEVMNGATGAAWTKEGVSTVCRLLETKPLSLKVT